MEQEFSEGDEEISEGAEYSPKSEFSKPKLVEEAVRKCFEARSQEMKEGYNNYKVDKQGDVTAKIWIPDTRKVFNAHVIALRNLLSPEIKNNKNFQNKEKKIRKAKKVLFNKYCYTIKVKKREGNKLIWVDTKEKLIPDKDAYCISYDSLMKVFSGRNGLWNDHISNYWNGIVLIDDKLFAILNELCDSLNYFKQKVSY